jgi:hypothetical protein
LKTRLVCSDCNGRTGREIDERLAAYLMVKMQMALADVRSLRHQQKEPVVDTDAVISHSGEPATIRFSPRGREVRRPDGTPVHEIVEISYGLDSDLWVRFIAKVALGCAAQLYDDDWHDTPIASALRALLWHGRIDPAVWPHGVPGWPDELAISHPVRQGLGDDRHLIGLLAADDDVGSSVAHAFLFGGQITCALPLPGLQVDGSGPAWVIDWHPGAPPAQEDFDEAIERLLREHGWTTAQIDAVRLSD